MSQNIVKTCMLCDKQLNIPTKLDCGDIFCFTCIKTYVLDCGQKCPICKQLIIKNLAEYTTTINMNKSSFRWVFSSTFNDGWWCYDDVTNLHIEKIYHDYLKRTNQIDKLTEITKEYNKNFEKSLEKTDDTTKSSVDAVKKGKFYDFVDFSNTSNKVSDIIDKFVDQTKKDDELTTYVIIIGSNKYLIDFDHMKQIHTADHDKKRSIQRISILDENNLTEYLIKNHKIKGVAGIKFKQ